MANRAKQHVYRRLMKEVKGKNSTQQQKIDHPLARYNALGQLSCIVCQQMIKSDILWGTHLKSRRHKEVVAELKNKKELLQQTKTVRSETATRPPTTKKQGSEVVASHDGDGREDDGPLEEAPSDKKQRVTSDVVEEKPRAREQTDLPGDFFDPGVTERFGEDGDGDSGDEGKAVRVGTGEAGANSKASAGVTDSAESRGTTPASSKDVKSGTSALPEGFFDDPKMDAKVRKVEYKNKMDEEWERFQKTIQKENDVSEAIQFEEDQEAQGDRDLTEIQEQVGCFQRAEVLRLKQEELLERRGEVEETAPCTSKDVCRGEKEGGVVDEDGSSDKDDELEMDWRAKHS